MSLRVGQRVGPYVVESLLGAGGMATVWRAWDDRSSEHVAIKIMADALADDAQLTARFIDELRRHVQLHHPHIVAVRDVFSIGGKPCMVMDLIPGGSLAAALDASPERRLSVEVARPLMLEVLDALDYAHRKGIVHRDVKPSNILLDAQHQHAWLSDFGIALTEGEKRRTRVGVSVGTNAYMSPEQIRAEKIDFRSDVYAMGCVLYETLTGRPPFVAVASGDNSIRAAVLAAHLRDQPVAPRRRVASIPANVSELIMSALMKDPARRVAGCAEFARLLSAPARTPGGAVPRKVWIAALVALALIVGVLALLAVR
ncbi:serine/threonine-protein kinase [Paraburkholderia aromaticivorans]|uniref:serine/threonine-protein kinase n=1 Tax=Paraburkholderia aromaticivorans TaxID=2026199 RepID=UPI0014560096|nr:serine/threonine-protein kinase [Paraburkholderia aromaticivorans]